MATYIQGVTDYIPHLQPFRPDLNFYQSVLERKEAQYSQGYNKLSSVYGTLLNSPMLRGINNERRDEFFKTAETNIKKMSELDLSLEENVDAAYQVFQPLIDDNNIMKDMAWTKHWQNENGKAEGFRNCIDEEKCGGKWWEGGVQALNYMAEDFSRSDDNTALTMGDARFTPFVNGIEKSMKYLKDLGVNVTSVDLSDPKWIVTQKNGIQILPQLNQLLLGTVGRDPALQDFYNIQGYLTRKNYMKQHAEEFGGEDGAESQYLTEMLKQIDTSNAKAKEELDNTKKELKSTKTIVEDKINNSGGVEEDDPLVEILNSMYQQEDILKGTEQHIKTTSELTDKSTLLGADKKTLRWRVDNAVGGSLLSMDMYNAALTFASLNSETKIEANPYTKMHVQHSLDLDKMSAQYSLDLQKYGKQKDIDLIYQTKLQELKRLTGRTDRGMGMSGYNPIADDKYNASSSSAGDLDEQELLSQKLQSENADYIGAQGEFAKDYYRKLQNIAADTGNDISPTLKTRAAEELQKLFGNDYDMKTRTLKTGTLDNSKYFQENKDKIYDNIKNTLKTNKILYPEHTFDDTDQQISLIERKEELYNAYETIYRKNNLNIATYMPSVAGVDDQTKANIKHYIDPKGNKRNLYQYTAAKLKEMSPEGTLTKELVQTYADVYKDEYDDLSEDFTKVSKSNPFVTNADGSKKYMIQSMDPSAFGELGTGGRFTKSIQGTMDYNYDDKTLMDFIKLYDAFSSTGGVGVMNSWNGAISADDVENDPISKAVLDRFADEMKNGSFKAADGTRPQGDLVITTNVGGDANLIGVYIKPSQLWGESSRVKGTKTSAGVTADGKYKEGIQFFLKKDQLPPDVRARFEVSPTQVILSSGKPIKVEQYSQYGGYATITKNPNGPGYATSGFVKQYDPKTNRLITVQGLAGLDQNPMVDPDVMLQNINVMLQQQYQINYKTMQATKEPGPIKNTKQLKLLQ